MHKKLVMRVGFCIFMFITATLHLALNLHVPFTFYLVTLFAQYN